MSFWPQFSVIVFLSMSCAPFIFKHLVCKILKRWIRPCMFIMPDLPVGWHLPPAKPVPWKGLSFMDGLLGTVVAYYLGRERQGIQGVWRGHRNGKVHSSVQSQHSVYAIIIKKENKEAVTWHWILISLLERGLQLLLCYTHCLIQTKSLALLAEGEGEGCIR